MKGWQFCYLAAAIGLAPHATPLAAMISAVLWVAVSFFMKDDK